MKIDPLCACFLGKAWQAEEHEEHGTLEKHQREAQKGQPAGVQHTGYSVSTEASPCLLLNQLMGLSRLYWHLSPHSRSQPASDCKPFPRLGFLLGSQLACNSSANWKLSSGL